MSIAGARPQYIKATAISKALLEAGHKELLVNTGQHYDYAMSKVFFDEMEIPQVNINLNVGSDSHARQTARMLISLEDVMLKHQPDVVIVHGDTNTTLAGALAACKLQIPVAHNEAGLRSFNRTMPEEHNRVLTDHCSDFLFCPTQTAVEQLALEGVEKNVHMVGDVMFDTALAYREISDRNSTIIRDMHLTPGGYLLVTVHRSYNTDVPERLSSIFRALGDTGEKVVFPIHPRTAKYLQSWGIESASNVQMIEPVGYLDMIALERHAKMILTDSGGVQKEAYFYRVPCVTLRPETEWVETVANGWNCLVDADSEKILSAVQNRWWSQTQEPIFGDGKAAQKIVRILESAFQ